MSAQSQRPEPPYYAVIFSSRRSGTDEEYAAMSERMVARAAQQPGFLGVESARDANGFGITVSYWRTAEEIAAWRAHAEHSEAREQGRASWYSHYDVRIAKVERAYRWGRTDGSSR